MHPPLLPSRLARDHGHGAGPSLPDPAADVFRLRPRSDLLHLPWFPVRPAPPHDECASEERRVISRSHACPWADPAGSPDCPGPSRRRGAGRRNAGSSMVRLLLRDRDHVYTSVEVDPTRLDQSEPHRRSRGPCRRGGGRHGLFSASPSNLSFGGSATPVVRVSFIPQGRLVESLRVAGSPCYGIPGLGRRLSRV